MYMYVLLCKIRRPIELSHRRTQIKCQKCHPYFFGGTVFEKKKCWSFLSVTAEEKKVVGN